MAGLVFLSMSPESEVTGFAAILILTPTRRFRDASTSSQGHRTRFLQELTGIETYLIWRLTKGFPHLFVILHSFASRSGGAWGRDKTMCKSHTHGLCPHGLCRRKRLSQSTKFGGWIVNTAISNRDGIRGPGRSAGMKPSQAPSDPC